MLKRPRKDLLDAIEATRRECEQGILRIDEAMSQLNGFWDESLRSFAEGSPPWRLIDRRRREATAWFEETSSGYAQERAADHFAVVARALSNARALERDPGAAVPQDLATAPSRSRVGHGWDWVRENKQWLFSGVGVAALVGTISLARSCACDGGRARPETHKTARAGMTPIVADSETVVTNSERPLFMSLRGALSTNEAHARSPMEPGMYGRLRCSADTLTPGTEIIVTLGRGDCRRDMIFDESRPTIEIRESSRSFLDNRDRRVSIGEDSCLAYRLALRGILSPTFLHCSLVALPPVEHP